MIMMEPKLLGRRGTDRVRHAVPADIGGAEEDGRVEAGRDAGGEALHALGGPLPQVEVAAPGVGPAWVHVDDEVHLSNGVRGY